jgi:hypothetical protein
MANVRGVLDETEKEFIIRLMRENPIGESAAVRTANLSWPAYVLTKKRDREFAEEVRRVHRERMDRCLQAIFDEAVPCGSNGEGKVYVSIEAADLYIKNRIAYEKHLVAYQIGLVELAERRLAYQKAKGGSLDADRLDVTMLTTEEMTAIEKVISHQELDSGELHHYNDAVRKLREHRQGNRGREVPA